MDEQEREDPRPDESLAKDQRIARSAEFQAVMSTGSRGVGKHLVAFWSAARTGSPSRVGVVASRKVGGAVQRSRAKRLLREVYRRAPVRPLGDVVLIARRGIGAAPWDGLVREYRAAMRRAMRTKRQSSPRGADGARPPLPTAEGRS